MAEHYILGEDGKTPVECDLMTWARMFENGSRVVRKSTVCGIDVSTVFLGLNHQYGDGPPLLFETMIFGGEHDQYQERYSTWGEAEAGHEAAEQMIANDHRQEKLITGN